MFFRLALFGMARHRKRSLLIIASVAVSVAVMVFLSGMLEGMRRDFYDSMVRRGGHVQIHAAGWSARLNPYALEPRLDDYGPELSRLALRPGVLAAEAILPFGGLLLNGEKNLEIGVYGAAEESAFFSELRQGCSRGAFLPKGEGIALSERNAALLGLGLGSTVTLLVEDSEGAPAYRDFEVTGLFTTRSREFDDSYAFIAHSAAQELLYLPESTLEIRVELADPEDADALAAELAGWWPGEPEIATWKELNGSFLAFVRVFDILLAGMNLFIVLVAGTVITNAILMNVFERISEFGTMRAIGLKRRQLRRLVLSEGAVLGVAGSLAGLLLAAPLVLLLSRQGIDMGAVSDALGFGNTVKFALSARTVAMDFLFGALVAVVGSLYAGAVASRLSVIDCLRHR